MKTAIKIIILCAALAGVTSCFTTLALTGAVLSKVVPGEKVTLSGQTVRQIGDSNQCALLQTDGDATVCIVYDFGTYKDGKRIKDRFVRAGMYKYQNENGTELYAPIFIRKKDYNRLWLLAVQLDAGKPASSGQSEVYI